MRIELTADDLEDLALELARWRPDDVIRLIKAVDVRMGEWDLVLGLKPWVDQEVAIHEEEELRERRAAARKLRRQETCHKDPDSGVWIHFIPHTGCILR
jgi:hypothetical protein